MHTISTVPRKPGHVHRSRVDEPSGLTSVGSCSRCGALALFQNALDEGAFLTDGERREALAA